MKKFLCVFLALLLCGNCALAEEFARLYAVSADVKRVDEIVRPSLNIAGYRTITDGNFYVVENPSQNIYHVILLKQNGNDSYYYFLSNENLKLNKKILESLNVQEIDRKRIRNSAFLTLFHSEAEDFLKNSSSGIKTVTTTSTPSDNTDDDYDFSDEAQWRFDTNTAAQTPQIPLTVPQQQITTQQPQKGTTLSGAIVHIEAGQQFNATLSSTISSDSIANNDRISAQLDSDWVVNGIRIAPRGSVVSGEVVNSRGATFAMGDGKIGLNFTQIFTPDGKVIPLTANEVYIVGDSNRALKIAGRVASGAIGGLLIGALFLLGGADPTGALVSGAAIGGAFGAASAAASKGEEVNVPEGTVLQIMLAEPMTAQPYVEYN